MGTPSKRNRAKLALRLLEPPRKPEAGLRALLWVDIEADEENGHVLVRVTARVRSRAFVGQRVLADSEDIALVTMERP